MSLLEKRAKFKERASLLETIPGSGSYQDDPNSPAKLKQMVHSERPIAFVDGRKAVVVGGCAEQCLKALEKYAVYYEQHGDPSNAQERRAAEVMANIQVSETSDGRVLTITRQDLNDFGYALASVGVLIWHTSP